MTDPAADRSLRFGPYRALRVLGRGGMGAVYEVVHELTGARYALKTLASGPGGLTAGELERFRREGQLLARLEHPGIVRVHSAGVEGAVPYLVQELVAGESLRERLDAAGPLPVDQAVALAIELAEAVAHAHGRGVLHRDLKPANVLIGQDGAVRLADFGLSRSVGAGSRPLTATGDVLGTPSYMAPEQARGEPVDERTDVYGLGATLFALLAGRPPFLAGSALATLAAVTGSPPPLPSAGRPDVPPALDAVCRRAMAKAPADRYPSAPELAKALREALEAPAARWSGRPVAAALAVAAGVLALAALASLPPPRPPDDSGGRPATPARATPSPDARAPTPLAAARDGLRAALGTLPLDEAALRAGRDAAARLLADASASPAAAELRTLRAHASLLLGDLDRLEGDLGPAAPRLIDWVSEHARLASELAEADRVPTIHARSLLGRTQALLREVRDLQGEASGPLLAGRLQATVARLVLSEPELASGSLREPGRELLEAAYELAAGEPTAATVELALVHAITWRPGGAPPLLPQSELRRLRPLADRELAKLVDILEVLTPGPVTPAAARSARAALTSFSAGFLPPPRRADAWGAVIGALRAQAWASVARREPDRELLSEAIAAASAAFDGSRRAGGSGLFERLDQCSLLLLRGDPADLAAVRELLRELTAAHDSNTVQVMLPLLRAELHLLTGAPGDARRELEAATRAEGRCGHAALAHTLALEGRPGTEWSRVLRRHRATWVDHYLPWRAPEVAEQVIDGRLGWPGAARQPPGD